LAVDKVIARKNRLTFWRTLYILHVTFLFVHSYYRWKLSGEHIDATIVPDRLRHVHGDH